MLSNFERGKCVLAVSFSDVNHLYFLQCGECCGLWHVEDVEHESEIPQRLQAMGFSFIQGFWVCSKCKEKESDNNGK